MTRERHVERLVANYKRRLWVLREKQALEGWSVDVNVVLEIEEIENQLRQFGEDVEAVGRSLVIGHWSLVGWLVTILVLMYYGGV